MCYKADDDGRLSPAEKDNTVVRKIDRKGWTVFNLVDYKHFKPVLVYSAAIKAIQTLK